MAGAINYQIIMGNDVALRGSVGFTESTKLHFILATGSSDSEINLGGITTADVLFITSTQAITLNMNLNTGTDITIDANKPFAQMGTAVTAVYLSNASGTDAVVDLKAWGA